MSEEGKYPKFIWFVVSIIFLAVVAYALFSGQPIENIKVPGGEVKFGAKPEDQRFNFIVSYDIGRGTVQGETTIYIDGNRAATLYADHNRPGATATITAPKPGLYSYRLEGTEMSYVYNHDRSQQHLQKFNYSGEGKIEIQTGGGFKVVQVTTLHGKDLPPSETSLMLQPILSKEEQDAEDKKTIEWLNKEMGLK